MTKPTPAQIEADLVCRLRRAMNATEMESITREAAFEIERLRKAAAQVGEQADAVLVPVTLTDAMRARMRHIEDGPYKSHDEVWSEMLDAALCREQIFKQADAGEISWNEAQKRAAAQVGEPVVTGKSGYEYVSTHDEIVAHTIERCAQVLEAAYAECDTLNLLHGAARLRALKDAP